MDNLGQILEGLKKTMKNKPLQDFSDKEDLTTYKCIICRDTGRLLSRKNTGLGVHLAPDPDYPKDHILEEKEWISGKVKPDYANRWTSLFKECTCQEQYRKQKEAERILGSTNLSKKFLRRTLESFVFLEAGNFPKPLRPSVEELVTGQRKAFEMVTEYVSHYDDMKESGLGFGLWGYVGTGKTHLLAGKTLYLKQRKIQSVFVNTAALFEEIRNTYEVGADGKPTGRKNRSELLDLVQKAEDLSLDDVGTEPPKDWIREIFYLILNNRYENEMPTAFSTNDTPEELRSHLGKSYRRLTEPCMGGPGEPSRNVFITGPSFDEIRKEMQADPGITFR